MIRRLFIIWFKKTLITFNFMEKFPLKTPIPARRGIFWEKVSQTKNQIESVFYAEKRRKTDWCSHDHQKSILVISGSFELQIMDRTGFVQMSSYYAGDVAVVYAFQFHRIQSLSTNTKIYCTNKRP